MNELEHFSYTLEELEDGTLSMAFTGEVECEMCIAAFDKASNVIDQRIIEKAKVSDARVQLLIDVSAAPKFSDAAIEPLMQSVQRTRDYDSKTAVFGAGRAIKALANTLVSLTRHEEIRFFDTREEARTWLQTENNNGPA